MKKRILGLYCLFLNITLISAQWTSDPDNPGIICDATEHQRGIQTIPDGNDGIYVFWIDERNSTTSDDVYGQHLDENGIALWEEDGREILNEVSNIDFFNVYGYDDGTVFIGWVNNASGQNATDRLWFQKLDTEGSKIWSADASVGEEGSSIGSFERFSVVRDNLGFHICFEIQTYGYERIRISRLAEDGTLLMTFNGVEIGPLSLGHVQMTTDYNNGAFVYYSTGNGAGAALKCMHIDSEANELWAGWVNVTIDIYGLAYQYSGISDPNGITFAWVGNGVNQENLLARRLDLDGDFAWSDTTKTICAAAGSQERFFWKKAGNNYYMIWSDGRPGLVGNAGVYAQKFDMDGIMQWTTDGIQVANLSTYIPYPEFEFAENNSMVVCHKAGTGAMLQKVLDDGTILWDPAGVMLANNTYAATYDDFAMIRAGSNVVVAWAKSGGATTDNVYISRADYLPVNLIETISSCGSYNWYGQDYSQSGTYTNQLGGDTLATLELTILQSSAFETTQSSCTPISFNGETISTSGDYNWTISNEAGCDSLITLHFTLNSVNTNFTFDGTTLTAELPNADYGWLDCETGAVFDGNGDGQTFNPPIDSEYALIISNGTCIDTSACVSIQIIGIAEHFNSDNFTIYPNPGSDMLNISSKSSNPFTILVHDNVGHIIFNSSRVGIVHGIETSDWQSGVYWIEIKNPKQTTIVKWIKI